MSIVYPNEYNNGYHGRSIFGAGYTSYGQLQAHFWGESERAREAEHARTANAGITWSTSSAGDYSGGGDSGAGFLCGVVVLGLFLFWLASLDNQTKTDTAGVSPSSRPTAETARIVPSTPPAYANAVAVSQPRIGYPASNSYVRGPVALQIPPRAGTHIQLPVDASILHCVQATPGLINPSNCSNTNRTYKRGTLATIVGYPGNNLVSIRVGNEKSEIIRSGTIGVSIERAPVSSAALPRQIVQR